MHLILHCTVKIETGTTPLCVCEGEHDCFPSMPPMVQCRFEFWSGLDFSVPALLCGIFCSSVGVGSKGGDGAWGWGEGGGGCLWILVFSSPALANRGFPTRMVYLDYITCLRYTILVRNPWNCFNQEQKNPRNRSRSSSHPTHVIPTLHTCWLWTVSGPEVFLLDVFRMPEFLRCVHSLWFLCQSDVVQARVPALLSPWGTSHLARK